MKYSHNWLFALLILSAWYKTQACKTTEKRIRCPQVGYIPGKSCDGVSSWKCTPGTKRCACRDELFLHADGSCVKEAECGPDPWAYLRPPKTGRTEKAAANQASSIFKNAEQLIASPEDMVLLLVSANLIDISRTRCTVSPFVANVSGGATRRIIYMDPVASKNNAQAWYKRNVIANIVLKSGTSDRVLIEVDVVGEAEDALSRTYMVMSADSNSIAFGLFPPTEGEVMCTLWAKKSAAASIQVNSAWPKECSVRKARLYRKDTYLC